MTTKIVPHVEIKGIDILGARFTHIIRSDLGCYMRLSNDLHEGKDGKHSPTIFPLHETCAGGDHYLGINHSSKGGMWFGTNYQTYFIIKGNEYREVEDLTTDRNPKQGILHSNCQGGDFYMATSYYNAFSSSSVFIIVYKDEGMFKVVSDLSTGEKSMPYEYFNAYARGSTDQKYELHENCKGGLYYWATKSFWTGAMFYYVIKGVNEWGVEVHLTRDLHTDRGGQTDIINPSVVNFLPGGLAVNMGPSFGYWALIKTIDNTSGHVPLKWNKELMTIEGYRKTIQKQVEINWKLTTQYSAEVTAGFAIEKVFQTACKQQFSLSASFGGNYLDTTKEDWSEEKQVKEWVQVEVPPNKSVYIWQYKLGMDKSGSVLFTNYLKQTSDSTPPTNVPIPSSSAANNNY